MAFRHSLRESVETSGAEKPKGSHAERSYGRFFAGYTPVTKPRVGPDGRMRGTRTEYVYTGDIWRQRLTKRMRVLVRCQYAACWLGCCALGCYAATRSVSANSAWYAAAPQAAAVLGLMWMLVSLLYYITAVDGMTVYVYQTITCFHFRVSRILTFAAFALSALANALNLALDRSGDTALRLRVLGCMLLCALLSLSVCLVEREIVYYRKEGEA